MAKKEPLELIENREFRLRSEKPLLQLSTEKKPCSANMQFQELQRMGMDWVVARVERNINRHPNLLNQTHIAAEHTQQPV